MADMTPGDLLRAEMAQALADTNEVDGTNIGFDQREERLIEVAAEAADEAERLAVLRDEAIAAKEPALARQMISERRIQLRQISDSLAGLTSGASSRSQSVTNEQGVRAQTSCAPERSGAPREQGPRSAVALRQATTQVQG
jgi:hypothetical protein